MLSSALLALLAGTALAGPCVPDWIDQDSSRPENVIVGYHSQFGPQTITKGRAWKDESSLTETSTTKAGDKPSQGWPSHGKPSETPSTGKDTTTKGSVATSGWEDESSVSSIKTSSTVTSGWEDESTISSTTKSDSKPSKTTSESDSATDGWSNIPGSTSHSTGHGPTSTFTSTKSTSTHAVSTTTSKGTHPPSATTIQYSVVSGYFVQDDNATSPDGFDYATVNFGLINQTYDTDTDSALTQWQRFAVKLEDLQASAEEDTSYKLVFMGRHGEGNHNAMESYVGTPAWNCYWALLEGANSSFIYADAPVTEDGIVQAEKAHAYWSSRISEEKIPFIQSYYSSPMRRCLETAELTYADLDLPKQYPFKPIIKEGLREGMSEHTCNRRSARSWIAANYREFAFEAGFTEEDELWTGVTTEVPDAQDFRTKEMLDEIFGSDENTYLSFTSHSGEIASILRVIGHRSFRLSTGQIIPVLIKAQTTSPEDATTTVTSATWTPSPFCTQPPVTSIPSWGNGGGCECQNSAEPTITQLPDFPTITASPAPAS